MIEKCLFPVAGYGTRFLPATKAMPKEMMPIVNKPLIQYGVQEAMEAGMRQIAFVTGRSKRAIEDHFDRTYELEDQISGTKAEENLKEIRKLMQTCTFSYTRQIQMRGLGDAILTGETLIGTQPFGVILADDLCIGEDKPVLSQMLDVFLKYQCSIVAVEEVPPEETEKYGIISGKQLEEGLFIVESMVEKPPANESPSNHAIIGRYILTPDIFDNLRTIPPGRNGEIQITDALNVQAKKKMVLGYQFKGQRFDCGSLEGFAAATNHFFQRMRQEASMEER
ncbi:MAG: UTP--glucose-1-phosphate uridylyltransferase GalU [Magnetococcales bacterium]|nr:UTP--glucose-1-phosphate uridylyltransferase GalU [Magnetococcales bacterium]